MGRGNHFTWFFVIVFAVTSGVATGEVENLERIFHGKRLSGLNPVARTISRIAAPLIAAQMRLHPESLAAAPRVVVIDSTTSNAVLANSPTGPLIGITTELIEAASREADGRITEASANRGLARIAAVLAHEISHSNDEVPKEINWNTFLAEHEKSQANELRVDSDASHLLREARYPEEGLFQLNELLAPTKEPSRIGMFTSRINTHPQQRMRSVFSALTVTLNRYRLGRAADDALPKPVARYLSTLQALRLANPAMTPLTTSELSTQVHKILAHQGRFTTSDSRARAALEEIFAFARTRGERFTEPEATELGKLAATVAKQRESIAPLPESKSSPLVESKPYRRALVRQVGRTRLDVMVHALTPQALNAMGDELASDGMATLKKWRTNENRYEQTHQEDSRMKQAKAEAELQARLKAEGDPKLWWEADAERAALPATPTEARTPSSLASEAQYLEALTRFLKEAVAHRGADFTVADADRAHSLAFETVSRSLGVSSEDLGTKVWGDGYIVKVAAILAATLPPSRKAAILSEIYSQTTVNHDRIFYKGREDIFIGQAPVFHDLVRRLPLNEVQKLSKVLNENGVPFSIAELTHYPGKIPGALHEEFFRYQDAIKAEIRSRLAQVKARPADRARLIPLVQRALKYAEQRPGSSPAKPILDFASDVFSLLREVPLEPAELEAAHRSLIVHAATSESDRFFMDMIAKLPPQKEAEKRAVIERALKERRMRSEPIQLKLTEAIFTPENQKADQFESALSRLTEHLPQPSEGRDKLIERLLWATKAQSDEQVKKAEELKSYNPKQGDPRLVNDLSSMAETLEKLTQAERVRLMNHLNDPERARKGLPPEIERALHRIQRIAQGDDLADTRESILSGEKARTEHRKRIANQAEQHRHNLVHWSNEASQNERLALYAFLLSSGNDPLIKGAGVGERFNAEMLGVDNSTDKGKALLAFWDITPPEELASSMAYSLSRKQAGGGFDWADIFQIFGTVGIKGGQLGSIWNVFGDEISRAVAQLKDQADPLTMQQVLEQMHKELPAELAAKIKVEKILSCASVKCVVKVLIDGKSYVMGVRRPNAEAQIAWNLGRIRKLHTALVARGVNAVSSLLGPLISGLEAQLKDEIDLNREAEKLTHAGEFYSRMNEELKPKAAGWEIRTPKLAPYRHGSKGIILMEEVQGKAWKDLSDAEKREVGPLVVESALRGLIREGYFNPDQHTGNLLVNTKSKQIHMLDPGQNGTLPHTGGFWGTDDRYSFVQLLRALGEKNVKNIILHGKSLSKSTAELTNESGLEFELQRLLALPRAGKAPAEAQKDLITDVTRAFGDHHLELKDKVMFTALKGLMVLLGESYVPMEQAAAIIEREATALLTGPKKLRTALDEIRPLTCAKAFSLFRSLAKLPLNQDGFANSSVARKF